MKPWRETLDAHVQNWVARVPDKWVPRYVYHFTDVQNAAAVLRSGELLSRDVATARGAMQNDNAASAVLENTQPTHKQFARLYFRPRTPTQFQMEGIRPPASRYKDAHCPVPVFLAFDLVETILMDGVRFSDGNMANARVRHSDDESFFKSLPFDSIYHDGTFSPEQRDTIVFHRHAEILAPKALALEPTLKWIFCRSHAERETLLYLLQDARSRWEPIVKVGDQKLFYAKHMHVERFEVTGAMSSVTFHLQLPFGVAARVRFELQTFASKRWTWSSDKWSDRVLTLALHGAGPGVVRLWIEDCLAYAAVADYVDAPF